jgi:hypothetical protein
VSNPRWRSASLRPDSWIGVRHAYHVRVMAARNFRSGVSGCIVHYNYFIGLPHDAGGFVNRRQGAGQAGLLVMRGNSE